MDLGACLFPESGEVGEGGLPRPLLDSTLPQPTPAPSARRKPRVVAPARSRCRLWPSRSCAAGASCKEELLRLGVRGDDDRHVVTETDGSPLQPRSLTHAVSEFLKEWRVTLHGLRHSHASHMLASNIHPKIVQGTARPFLDRDHDGHLQPPDAEHAGWGPRRRLTTPCVPP